MNTVKQHFVASIAQQEATAEHREKFLYMIFYRYTRKTLYPKVKMINIRRVILILPDCGP